MRANFHILQSFRIRHLALLLFFAGVIHVTPVLAVPYTYDLSGDINGWVEVDFEATPDLIYPSGIPYLSWSFTTNALRFGQPLIHWEGTAPGSGTDNYLLGDSAILGLGGIGGGGGWDLHLYMNSRNGSVDFVSEGWPEAGPQPSGLEYMNEGYGRYVRRGVPEPQTIMLVAIGVLGLAAYEWRRLRQQRMQVGPPLASITT